MPLVLDLHRGESSLINGPELRWLIMPKISSTGPARLQFGKQIISSGEAVTPATRLYFASTEEFIQEHLSSETKLLMLHACW